MKCDHPKPANYTGQACATCEAEREAARVARVRRRIDRLARMPYPPTREIVADALLARRPSAAAVAETDRVHMVRLGVAEQAELKRLLAEELRRGSAARIECTPSRSEHGQAMTLRRYVGLAAGAIALIALVTWLCRA